MLFLKFFWVLGPAWMYIREITGHNLFNQVRPTIFKCRCKANQVLDVDKCTNGDMVIEGYNKTAGEPFKLRTAELGNVKVRDLTCTPGTFPKTLDKRHFILLESGVMYDFINRRYFSTNKFCFDHIREDDQVTLIAKVCQGVPSVSQCCPIGFILNSVSQCTPEKNFDFEPPLLDGSAWKNPAGQVHSIHGCLEGSELKTGSLSAPQSPLVLLISDMDDAVLQSKPRGFEEWRVYNSSDFCVAARNRSGGYEYEALFCKENPAQLHQKICSQSKCIRKCCAEKHVFDMDLMVCSRIEYALSLPFTKEISANSPSYKASIRPIVTGAPLCETFTRVNYRNDTVPIIHDNGFLSVHLTPNPLSPAKYCIEHLKTENDLEDGAFICLPAKSSRCSWKTPLLGAFLGVSLVFLLATFVIYVSINELRARMSGKCLICEVSSLLVAYSTLIAIRSAPDHLSSFGCRLAGIVEHISILAAFFWLNVMCYDMWSTIRSNRRMDDEKRTSKKFVFYSLYAWGCPLIIGIVAVIIDVLPESMNNILRPGFGKGRCFFIGRSAQWTYFFSFVVVLLTANMAFFIHIVVVLVKAQKSFRQVFVHGRTEGGNKDESHEKYWMYVKLFIVMGITWIAEVVSFEAELKSSACEFWVITSSINSLRGLFIFVIFVCKKTTLKKIAKAWYPVLEPIRRISGFRMDISSEELRSRVSHVARFSSQVSVSSRKNSTTGHPSEDTEVQMHP